MPKRYVIVGITAVAALWMYIDRVCFSTLAGPMKMELLLPHAPPTESDDAPAVEPAAEQANEQAGVRDVVQAVAAAHLNPGSPPP